MTKLERKLEEYGNLKNELERLRNAGQLFEVSRIKSKLDRVEEDILYLRKRQATTLSEILDKDEISKCGMLGWILQMHLCADIFCEAATYYKEYMLKHHNIRDSSIHKMAEVMEKNAAYIAGFVCGGENNALSRLIIDDEELLDSVRELILKYITEKLSNEH